MLRVIHVVVCAVILAFLLLPTLIVIPMSISDTDYLSFPPIGFTLKWYQAYFSDPAWQAATLFSLKIATMTAIASVCVGTPAAVALVRGRILAKELLIALVVAPLVVPQIITGVAIYLEFVPLKLNGTTLGFVIAHTTLSVPFVVIIVSAAIQRIDPHLEMAALSLGASQYIVILKIIAPLARHAITGGAIFAFLASFDETVVSFFISGVDNRTLTRKLFEDIDFSLSPIIAAVSTVFFFATVALAASGRLATRLQKRNSEED